MRRQGKGIESNQPAFVAIHAYLENATTKEAKGEIAFDRVTELSPRKYHSTTLRNRFLKMSRRWHKTV